MMLETLAWIVVVAAPVFGAIAVWRRRFGRRRDVADAAARIIAIGDRHIEPDKGRQQRLGALYDGLDLSRLPAQIRVDLADVLIDRKNKGLPFVEAAGMMAGFFWGLQAVAQEPGLLKLLADAEHIGGNGSEK